MRIVWTIVAAGGALYGAATTATGQEEAPAVPSGISLSLQEILVEGDAGGRLARFRYVALDLDSYGFGGVEGDFPVLCSDVVLPWAAAQPEAVGRVVISMAAAPVEFGSVAPDVTQFFEVFRLDQAACIWEGL